MFPTHSLPLHARLNFCHLLGTLNLQAGDHRREMLVPRTASRGLELRLNRRGYGGLMCHPKTAWLLLTTLACLTLSRAQGAVTLTTLVAFDRTNGMDPEGALILGSDGNFYGTTMEGGAFTTYGNGTVFRVTPNGAFT